MKGRDFYKICRNSRKISKFKRKQRKSNFSKMWSIYVYLSQEGIIAKKFKIL